MNTKNASTRIHIRGDNANIKETQSREELKEVEAANKLLRQGESKLSANADSSMADMEAYKVDLA